jgi:hypothetical protein
MITGFLSRGRANNSGRGIRPLRVPKGNAYGAGLGKKSFESYCAYFD